MDKGWLDLLADRFKSCHIGLLKDFTHQIDAAVGFILDNIGSGDHADGIALV